MSEVIVLTIQWDFVLTSTLPAFNIYKVTVVRLCYGFLPHSLAFAHGILPRCNSSLSLEVWHDGMWDVMQNRINKTFLLPHQMFPGSQASDNCFSGQNLIMCKWIVWLGYFLRYLGPLKIRMSSYVVTECILARSIKKLVCFELPSWSLGFPKEKWEAGHSPGLPDRIQNPRDIWEWFM